MVLLMLILRLANNPGASASGVECVYREYRGYRRASSDRERDAGGADTSTRFRSVE